MRCYGLKGAAQSWCKLRSRCARDMRVWRAVSALWAVLHPFSWHSHHRGFSDEPTAQAPLSLPVLRGAWLRPPVLGAALTGTSFKGDLSLKAKLICVSAVWTAWSPTAVDSASPRQHLRALPLRANVRVVLECLVQQTRQIMEPMDRLKSI